MPFLAARGQASRGYFGGGTPPDAPTAVVATRGNTQLSVAFSAPAFNGGLDITTYQYALSTDSYATWTTRSTGTTASPLVITGLTNGTSYQVKLRAVNALGAGAASDASTAVTPATIPGTPTSPSISSGSQSISVSWVAPSDGGDPPLTYTVETQKNSEAYVNRGTQTSPYTLSGLDNGATYRARITANNTVGSSATPAVTGDTVPSAVPSAPGFSSASSGNGTYTFNWTAPANNGAAITSYTVTITTANQTALGTSVTDTPANFTSGGNLTYTFSGLSNGSSYRAKVIATNVRGNSAETDSGAGGAQIPSTTPGAPTITSSSSGDQSYTVNWSAPASDGGAAYTYTVQITDANQENWSTEHTGQTATSYTFTGLSNGDSYRARVKAVNVRGSSAYVESTAKTPTFAAPTASVADLAGYGNPADTNTWYKRPIRVTFSPTTCLNYQKTEVDIDVDGSYSSSSFDFTGSGANQTQDQYTFYTIFGDVNIPTSKSITVTVTTYNTAGHGVSTVVTHTTGADVTHYTYPSTTWDTDTKLVTGGSMARFYFDWYSASTESVRSAVAYARIDDTSANTVTSSRNPSLGLSSTTATTGTGGGSINMLDLPNNPTVSGSTGVSWPIGGTTRSKTWNHTDQNTGFDTGGSGNKYSVAGDGSITGTWTANQRIDVYLKITYLYRVTNLI
jgi:hypothetical protein